jgi:Tol biopolymer transport system component
VQLTRGPIPARSPFWSPDGTRVYFLSGLVLWSVSAVGGEPEPVINDATSAALHPRDGRFVFARAGRLLLFDPSTGSGAQDPQPFGQAPFMGTAAVASAGVAPVLVRAFSHDGTKLAVVRTGKLWLLSYPGGSAREIGLGPFDGLFVNWMPDSRHVVTARVQDGQGVGLALVDTETGTMRTILTGPMLLMDPRGSPDGRRIAFVTGDDRSKLIEVTLADGRTRELGSGGRISIFPSLSPDGTRLAFVDGSAVKDGVIREMLLEPTGETVARTIAVVEGGTPEHVQWSPDGARILFTALTLDGRSGLMVAPAGGGRALLVDATTVVSRGGSWSPDGTRIVYRRQIGDEHQIVTVRVGTSAAPSVLKRWPVGEALYLPQGWSPDGRWILVRREANVSLLASDGSSERPLFSTSGLTEFARLLFSRDGREVMMLRRDMSAAGRGAWKLFATDVASGAERVMTTVDLPGTAQNLAGLSLSPDGKRLYTSYADASFDIWMLEGFQ